MGLVRSAEGNLVRMRAGSQPPPGASGANIRTFQGPERFMSPFTQVPKLVFLLIYNRAAQCIDKEVLISKNGNIDIDIEIDKRMF